MHITGSMAIIPKARGIYAKRLTLPEYEELLRRRSVPEVAALLKKQPYFKDGLATLSTTDTHRGQIEELLNMDIFNKYLQLSHYDFSRNNFSIFYLDECELREILKVLHLLSIGVQGGYLGQIPPYLDNATDVDLFRLGQARSFAEVVEVLRHTSWYKPVRQCFEADPLLRDFALTEAALLRHYYEDVFRLVNESFSGREKETVANLFLLEAEIYNLELLVRVKTYYAGAYSAAETKELLLPYRYRIPKRTLHAMTETPGIEQLRVLLRQAGAEKYTGPIKADELDATSGRVLYRYAQRMLRLTTSPSAALAAFVTLAKLERDNVVNVVEGVRYNLPPETIRKLLRH